MIEPRPAPARVFLVDDDPAAVMLIRIGLEECGAPIQLDVATSCRAALERLHGWAAAGAGTAPDLVLLDLNLGDGSGHDLLECVRAQPALARIPVVILSTSAYAKDMERAVAAGADDYIVKPSSYDALLTILAGLDRYVRQAPASA